MSTFASLLKYRKRKPPAEAQKRARLDFPKRVSQSNLTLRATDQPVSDSGKRFIIGIATYSPDELDLLDELERACVESRSGTPNIEVFDVLNCKEMSDFARFIPGIDAVYGTPIIGVFSHGKLIHQATGLSDVVGTLRRFNAIPHEHARR